MVAPDRLKLDTALPEARCARIRLGPLSLAALHEVLKRHVGHSFSRRTLLGIERACAGNPFFALELARALPEHAYPSSTIASIPENLRELIRERVEQLPQRARKALLAAAALGSPTVQLVGLAVKGSPASARRVLEQAEAAEIVVFDGTDVRFAHPLYAAAVYSLTSPSERRLMHRRLAEVVDGVEERARHLALEAQEAEETLASTLEAAAEHARRRGAPDAAAELAEQARALTPRDRAAELRRRTVQSAEFLFHAGELPGAREMLEEALRDAPSGHERVDALRLLGEIRYHEDSYPEAIRIFGEALEHAGDDLGIESAIETRLAFAIHATGDFAAAKGHADRALALAERFGEPGLLAEALAVAAMANALHGSG
jgi:tetratricopeptide (TPR) repeat protein